MEDDLSGNLRQEEAVNGDQLCRRRRVKQAVDERRERLRSVRPGEQTLQQKN